MEVRAARAGERDQVLDLLALWYGDRAFFARYNLNDPAFRDELCLVALDSGRIVSTVQIFDRAVKLGAAAVPMGGIGSVYTLERYRGRGLASALMRLAGETMAREGFDLSLLFAERLGFYARFGYLSVERLFTVLSASPGAALAPQRDRYHIEPFVAARDLAQVSRIYGRYSGRFDSTIVRSASYWRGNLLYAGNPDEYFVVARAAKPGRADAEAYARAISFYGFPMVMEFGYLPDCTAAALALFGHLHDVAPQLLAAHAPGFSASATPAQPGAAHAAGLVSHTAHDPELERHLRQAGFILAHHKDVFYMWRVVDAARLGRRLALAPAAATARMVELMGPPRALFWTADRF